MSRFDKGIAMYAASLPFWFLVLAVPGTMWKLIFLGIQFALVGGLLYQMWRDYQEGGW